MIITKSERVLNLKLSEDVAKFTNEDDVIVVLDLERWRDMGSPTAVTVSIVPGDALND